MKSSTTTKIQFRLHPKQLEIYRDQHRYEVVEAGRRWGKTELAWIKNLVFMLEHPGCLTWWVAPLYKELVPATKKVRDLTPKGMISKQLESNETIRYLRIFNGSECFFHSADREDSLRGSGLHRLTIDEAPLLKHSRYESELAPSLIDFNAPVMFIGTPKPKSWFSNLVAKGKDPKEPEWKSWHGSSYDNAKENGGFLPKTNIDAIASGMTELLKRQEIFAEELEGEGVVFRNIVSRIRDEHLIKPYEKGEVIVVGSDIAKTKDLTVNIACRLTGEIVGFERFNQVEWPLIRKRTIAFCHRFGDAYLLIDSTGLGDPVYDEIQREYSSVQGYKLTNPTKKALIENLSITLDNGKIAFPGNFEKKEFSTKLNDEFPVLKSELESFTYEIGPTGLVHYGAPEGLHDDCVIALALMAWQLKTNTGLETQPVWVFG